MNAWILLIFMVVGLTGCGGGRGLQDLEAWVATQRATIKGRDPDPIPQLQPYQPFEYQAVAFKDPFAMVESLIPIEEEAPLPAAALAAISDPNAIRPDPTRPREELERFAVSSLSMVGTLQRPDGEIFALIKAPDGIVHRIRNGNFLGLDHGEVQTIDDLRIELREIVPDDTTGGWKERNTVLTLAN